MNTPKIIAISGVKNSGKTTLIEKLLPHLCENGRKVVVLKHDGHDFEADVPGTDTYRHLQKGAYATVCFSATKFMITENRPDVTPDYLAGLFPEADMILLEGGKYTPYPKVEVIRKGNSKESVCRNNNLIAIASDYEREVVQNEILGGYTRQYLPVFGLDEEKTLAEFLMEAYRQIQM